MKKIFPILVLSCFQFAMAQGPQKQFELKGSLGTNVTANKKINFNLKWMEKDGKAAGTYSDNFYAKSATVRGISGDLGRIFIVTFPQKNRGVRSITFLASDFQDNISKEPIPLSAVLRDEKGKPVSTSVIEATLIPPPVRRVAQRQVASECQEGFGLLANYCGTYSGMITEEVDSNKCDLLSYPNIRLVLDTNAEIGLSLGDVNEIVTPPVHRIGRLFTDPESTRIDVTSRSCRPISGTTFNGDNCKRLNLSGNFSLLKNVRHFTGFYSIIDEKNNDYCRYRLSMDQML